MATRVDSAASAAANPGTYHSRRVDRQQDGTMWSVYQTAAGLRLAYSKDNGATWTSNILIGTSGNNYYGVDPQIFIDLDDYIHVVFISNGTSGGLTTNVPTYVRGTPNAGRTDFTWGGSIVQFGQGGSLYSSPHVLAFRNPSGTGWVVAVAFAYQSGTTNVLTFASATIATNGVFTWGTGGNANWDINRTDLGQIFNQPSGFFPSMDFRHTGDGKTVAGGSPDLFFGWTHTNSGTNNGVRFLKASWSTGATWTWGAIRSIDSTRFNTGAGGYQWHTTNFDGTRVTIAGTFQNSATGNRDMVVYDRDAADTTTTTYVLSSNPAAADVILSGSATWDNAGNVYLFGRSDTGASGTRPLNYRKWTRATASLGGPVNLDAGVSDAPVASAKRGYSGNRVEVVWIDGTSPYTQMYEGVTLNTAPLAPTLTGPANNATIDRTIAQRFSWTFNDPDAGDTQSDFDLQYRVGSGAWTTVSGTTPNNFYDFAPAALAAGTYEWQVRTKDSQGVQGPWSTSSFVTLATPPVAPVITAPGSGSTIPTNSALVTWSAPNQEAYQIRTVADLAGAADTSTIYTDTGTVVDTPGRSRTVGFPVNNRFEHIQVRVRVAGLWSTWASIRVQIAFTPPPVPTLGTIADDDDAYIRIVVVNPAPGGGEPAVIYNDIYRRTTSIGGTGNRVATNVATNGTWDDHTVASDVEYEYKIVAVATNGTSTDGAWTA